VRLGDPHADPEPLLLGNSIVQQLGRIGIRRVAAGSLPDRAAIDGTT